MNVFQHVEDRIAAALAALKAEGALPAELALGAVEVEATKDASHGDVASNAAMVLAKPARMKPRDIAELLRTKLADAAGFAKIDIAGPGFLNITLDASAWQSVVGDILRAGSTYGRTDLGQAQAVNVEYVSANPTGPMHVGHGRGAVFGDALANLLTFIGYKVTREYYINDAGGQVNILAKSAFARYREALGETGVQIPEGGYPGEYLKPVGAALAEAHGKALLAMPEEQWLPLVRKTASDMMMASIREDLAALDIKHDVFFSEASLKHDNVDEVADSIAALRKRGHIFEGHLEKPKGHDIDDWEDRPQTLFRSTAFGDDVDRALMKSDGSYTYFASDLAYHHNKLARGFTHLINVFGADHVGYIKRITSVVRALSDGKADLDIKVCQMVRLTRNGETVKMGKRLGTFITLRDVVDEVGRDAVRFMMLFRKNDATLDFDLAKVIEQSKENPVFYVQMAHARAHSAFRNAQEAFPEILDDAMALAAADMGRLSDAGEIDLMRRLALFPRVVAGAARVHEPHRLAFYLHDVASAFHSHWSRGNDSPYLRIIQANDQNLTIARLALVRAFAQVIATGLAILGVEAPREMR